MTFGKLEIPGAFLIRPDKKTDERGFFARTFCTDEFREAGLHTQYPQSNISFNEKRGTFRGMHFQTPPFEEPKVVRCTQGAIFDVILDLRSDSPAFKKWIGVELSSSEHNAVYIPPGCAHGFQALTDGAEVFYMMGALFKPDANTGVRWDDVAFNIRLPLAITVVAQKDMQYPNFSGRD